MLLYRCPVPLEIRVRNLRLEIRLGRYRWFAFTTPRHRYR